MFFGGLYGGRARQDACVYNLKEGRIEDSRQKMKNIYCPKVDHAAFYYERLNQIIFFGGEEERGASRYGDEHANPSLQLIGEGGNFYPSGEIF